jgi:ligand-binding sensor domain-containing protein
MHRCGWIGALLTLGILSGGAAASDLTTSSPPTHDWTRVGREHGLPANKTLAVEVLDGEIWAGTSKGLGRGRIGGPFHKVSLDSLDGAGVLSLRADHRSKDMWVGTFEGLARVSRGRVDIYTQLNSGLANNVVYGLEIQGPFLWAATAAGLSRLDTRNGRWDIFNERNSPMKETWCYGVKWAGDYVYAAVWGSGILEYTISKGIWKTYFDPDGEFELDLIRDDGPVSNISSGVDFDGKILWHSSYFGVSRYDGRHWKEYYQSTGEGLPSNFVNSVRIGPTRVWACTDKGLASFDGTVWTHEIRDVQIHTAVFDGVTTVAATDNGVWIGRPTSKTGTGGTR